MPLTAATDLNDNLIMFNDLALAPCTPPRFARSGHGQTIWGHLLPGTKLTVPGQRHQITLSDGDELVCFYHQGPSDTLVYLFHGLTGSIDSNYMHTTAITAMQQGHSVFLVNHRDCGAGAGYATKPYHSGCTDDIAAVITYGRKQFNQQFHIAIGFSLSGNALLLTLCEKTGGQLPDAAISVNAPINLDHCSLLISSGVNHIYSSRFVRSLRRSVFAKQRLGITKKQYKIPRRTTLRQFDEIYLAPEAGFKDRMDYYQQCSTYQRLHEIKTPTILIASFDDPFIAVSDYQQASLSPQVLLHIERYGGHIGYLTKQRTPLLDHRWLDYALGEYLKALVKECNAC